jgi:thiol-disulfide isomerase/thioredoxin
MCVYKDMTSEFDIWREEGDSQQEMLADKTLTEAQQREYLDNWPTLTKMWPLYLDAIKNPYIRQKAEHFRDRRLAQKDLATPLPSTPEAELIRKLVAKYPGRFLFIDFWGMTCGPCRAAIQGSREKRAEIAARDDV